MGLNVTHTCAVLSISTAAHQEILRKLKEAGYDHAFDLTDHGDVLIDMHGVELRDETEERAELLKNAQPC